MTAELLWRRGSLPGDTLGERVVTVEPGDRLRIGDGIDATAFAVPHFPGAVGWTVRDAERAVIYTGDICLRTARHDYIDALCARVAEQAPRAVTVLVDATMAGRGAGASQAPAADLLLERGDVKVAVVADAAEHLLYAYLDLFHRVRSSELRNQVSFVVTAKARPLFQLLHAAFIQRHHDRLDPFVLAQYGTSMSAWGETRWLYWTDTMTAPPAGRTFWFLTAAEHAAGAMSGNHTVIRIGRDDTGGGHSQGVVADEFDTTAWTAHSNEASLADGVRALAAAGCEVVLFHNFSKRTAKFIRTHALRARPLSGTIDLTAPPTN